MQRVIVRPLGFCRLVHPSAELAGAALGLTGLKFSASPNERVGRLGWEVQATGIVVLGAGWLAVLGSAGFL